MTQGVCPALGLVRCSVGRLQASSSVVEGGLAPKPSTGTCATFIFLNPEENKSQAFIVIFKACSRQLRLYLGSNSEHFIHAIFVGPKQAAFHHGQAYPQQHGVAKNNISHAS